MTFIPGVPADMMDINGGVDAFELLSSNMQAQIIAAFVTVFVTTEFHFETTKTTISHGMGRIQIYFSKFLICSVGAVVILLAFASAHVIIGTPQLGV